MAVSTQLFELIKTLTDNEKRHFRRSRNWQKGERNYLLLFDYLNGQGEYDEEDLKREFTGHAFLENLHVTKNYLYNLILSSLRSFHASVHAEQKIGEYVTDMLLLEDRGLYEQARKALKRAKKQAYQFQCYYHLEFLLRKESEYLLALNEKKLGGELAAIKKEWSEVGSVLNAERTAFFYYFEAGYLQRNRSSNQTAIEDFRRRFEQEELSQVNSFYCSFLSEAIKAALVTFSGDQISRYLCNERIVDHWRSYPEIIRDKPQSYKVQLANLLNAAFRIDNYDAFPAIIKEMETVPSRNFNEEAETFQSTSFYKLLYYLNTRNLDKAKKDLKSIINILSKYASKITKARELAFYYNISILYFLLDDLENAVHWLNKIIHHSKTDHRKDLQRFSQVFQILYHYSLRNFVLAENLLLSVRKKLKRWSALTDFEEIVFVHIRHMLGSVDKSDQRQILSQFDQKLAEFRIKQESEVGTLPLGFEEVRLWINRQLDKL